MSMDASTRRDHRQEVTDALVRMLEDGVAPWQKPWEAIGMPFNPATGKPYRGGNAVHLLATQMEHGYQDPRWMTYRQAANNGYQVRKGEKGTRIEFWEIKDRKPADVGKTEDSEHKEPAKRLIHRVYTVFNAQQIDGVAPYQPAKRSEFETVQSAERILINSGASIFHDQRDRAFYNRTSDSIHLPPKEAFADAPAYYGTALHELGHWTGHPERLNRATLTESYRFGDTNYAKEELRAELASVFLSAELNVPHDPANHAAYVGAWIEALKNDKNEIFRAAHDASAAADFILAMDREKHRGEELAVDRQNRQVPMMQDKPRFCIADDSYAFIDKSGKFGELKPTHTQFYPDLRKAYEKAIELKEIHQERLEGGDLHIYKAQGKELSENPVLNTGHPAFHVRNMLDHYENDAEVSKSKGQGRILEKIGKYFGEYELGVYREEKEDARGAVWKVPPSGNSIGYLKAMNAQGNHIFIRPSFEKEPQFIMCDDLNRQDLDTHHKVKGKWKPGRMVVETSPENYQVWIRTDRELTTDEKKYWLGRLNSDPGASPLHRWGRCPGFRNRKEKYLDESGYPLAKLVWVDWKSRARVPEVQIELPEKKQNVIEYPARVKDNTGLPVRADYQKGGQSETDFAYAMALLRRGVDRQEVKQRILAERDNWDNHKGEKRQQQYLETTLANAEKVIREGNHYRITVKKNGVERSMFVDGGNMEKTEEANYLQTQAKRFAAKIGFSEADQLSISIARLGKNDDNEPAKDPKIEMGKGR